MKNKKIGLFMLMMIISLFSISSKTFAASLSLAENTSVLSIVLLVAAVVLFIIEIFLPTFGIIFYRFFLSELYIRKCGNDTYYYLFNRLSLAGYWNFCAEFRLYRDSGFRLYNIGYFPSNRRHIYCCINIKYCYHRLNYNSLYPH